ncbi:hypothetical protein P7C70_g2162, partial [Phenoliferia sp. Uapishka_3]
MFSSFFESIADMLPTAHAEEQAAVDEPEPAAESAEGKEVEEEAPAKEEEEEEEEPEDVSRLVTFGCGAYGTGSD